MKKHKQLKTSITLDEIDQGWRIVRGMIEKAEGRIILTARDRMIAMKQIKHLIGNLRRPPLLKGTVHGAKRNLESDLAVIADIKKFGTLPKSIRAHMQDGGLSRYTTERAHYDRIRALRKSA